MKSRGFFAFMRRAATESGLRFAFVSHFFLEKEAIHARGRLLDGYARQFSALKAHCPATVWKVSIPSHIIMLALMTIYHCAHPSRHIRDLVFDGIRNQMKASTFSLAQGIICLLGA